MVKYIYFLHLVQSTFCGVVVVVVLYRRKKSRTRSRLIQKLIKKNKKTKKNRKNIDIKVGSEKYLQHERDFWRNEELQTCCFFYSPCAQFSLDVRCVKKINPLSGVSLEIRSQHCHQGYVLCVRVEEIIFEINSL